jgi:hypothetical protein
MGELVFRQACAFTDARQDPFCGSRFGLASGRIAPSSMAFEIIGKRERAKHGCFINCPCTTIGMGNPVQRGHHFQRKADSNPVIADSG